MIISDIQLAASWLREGKIVAFPTETVYGLGAAIFCPEAIERLFEVKKRPQDNPLIAHISQLNQIDRIAHRPPREFYRLAEAFFPGPLTILLTKKEGVPDSATAHLPFLGVRMPNHSLARALIDAVGQPLVAPSANLSGKPSSTTAQHVIDDFGAAIAGVLDGGPCSLGIESTVIQLAPEPIILRPGAITQADLEKVLQCPVSFAQEHVSKPLSPGMKYRHYAPEAKVHLFYEEEHFQHFLRTAPEKKRAIFPTIHSKELYAALRQADAEGCEEIVILCNPCVQHNRGLMNRLLRASQ